MFFLLFVYSSECHKIIPQMSFYSPRRLLKYTVDSGQSMHVLQICNTQAFAVCGKKSEMLTVNWSPGGRHLTVSTENDTVESDYSDLLDKIVLN